MPVRMLLVVLFVVFAFALLVSVVASAQSTEGYKEHRFGVGIGLYKPVDDNLRGGTYYSPIGVSKTWLDIRLQYTISRDVDGRPKTFAALDWIAPSGNFIDTRMMPITINRTFRPFQEKMQSFYLRGGVGIYDLRVAAGTRKASAMKFGYVIGGGVEFRPASRLELTYNWAPKWKDAIYGAGYSFSGFSLTYSGDAF